MKKSAIFSVLAVISAFPTLALCIAGAKLNSWLVFISAVSCVIFVFASVDAADKERKYEERSNS